MLSHIPLWVLPLFLFLLWMGQRQSRPRTMSPALAVSIAVALLGLSVYGVLAAFGARPIAVVCWAAGFAASLTMGTRVFGPGRLAMTGDRSAVNVPGSWLPMALLIGMFGAKFALGFLAGTGSPMLQQLWFVSLASVTLGLLSGGFATRSIAVFQFARAANRGGVRVPQAS